MSAKAQCPRCGAPIAFHVSSSLVTVCEHCSTAVARTDRALEDLGRTADLVHTGSPLALWQSGRLGGIGFQITGHVQIQHPAGGLWDEWYLCFDDGRWGWLAEAQGRFLVTFQHGYDDVIDPQTLAPGRQIRLAGEVMVVTEVSEGMYVAGRGEMPYRFQPGQRFFFADLSGAGGRVGTLDFGARPPTLFMGREVALGELGIEGTGDAHGHQPRAQVAVEALSCQHCGGALELPDLGAIERVVCPYCGSMHDCRSGLLALVEAQRRSASKLALPLGSRGTFEDITFTVIGFLRRKVTVHGESFTWDEYLLYEPSRGFRWLSCSEGHWMYLRPIAAGDVRSSRSPASRAWRTDVAEHGGKTFEVFQQDTAQITHVAGAFYWKVTVGERTLMTDYVAPPEMLSAEVAETEIQWTLGRYMTRRELRRCFPDVDVPRASPEGVAPAQPFAYKDVYPVWGVLLALVLLAGAWNCHRSPERDVFDQRFTIPAQTGEPAEESIVFSEPFQLHGSGLIQVRAGCNQLDNSWIHAQADLVNEDTGSVHTFDMPIEYYHGTEGGEAWTEGSRQRTRILSAVSPGSYVVRLAVERSKRDVEHTLAIDIDEGVFYWRGWLVTLLLVSLLPICMILYHVYFERRRWRDSEYKGSDE